MMENIYLFKVITFGQPKSSPPYSTDIDEFHHLVYATRLSLAKEKVIEKYSNLVKDGTYSKFEIKNCEIIR